MHVLHPITSRFELIYLVKTHFSLFFFFFFVSTPCNFQKGPFSVPLGASRSSIPIILEKRPTSTSEAPSLSSSTKIAQSFFFVIIGAKNTPKTHQITCRAQNRSGRDGGAGMRKLGLAPICPELRLPRGRERGRGARATGRNIPGE